MASSGFRERPCQYLRRVVKEGPSANSRPTYVTHTYLPSHMQTHTHAYYMHARARTHTHERKMESSARTLDRQLHIAGRWRGRSVWRQTCCPLKRCKQGSRVYPLSCLRLWENNCRTLGLLLQTLIQLAPDAMFSKKAHCGQEVASPAAAVSTSCQSIWGPVLIQPDQTSTCQTLR